MGYSKLLIMKLTRQPALVIDRAQQVGAPYQTVPGAHCTNAVNKAPFISRTVHLTKQSQCVREAREANYKHF